MKSNSKHQSIIAVEADFGLDENENKYDQGTTMSPHPVTTLIH